MQLHQIEVAFESLVGGREGGTKALAAQAPGERGQLGGQREGLAIGQGQLRAELAEQGLAAAVEAPGSIGIGCIKKVQPQGHGPLEALAQGPVLGRVVAPEQLVAPGPGAHTDAGRCRGGNHGHSNRAIGAMIGLTDGPAALTLPQEPPGQAGTDRSSPHQGWITAGAGEAEGAAAGAPKGPTVEAVLCGHCGRTASNGLSCQGICVADSGY